MNLEQENDGFAKTCAGGHPLQGKVRYCPFCGIPVTQPIAKSDIEDNTVVAPPPRSTSASSEPVRKESKAKPVDEPAPAEPKVQEVKAIESVVKEPETKESKAEPDEGLRSPNPEVKEQITRLKDSPPPPFEPKVKEPPPGISKFLVAISVLAVLAAVAFVFLKGNGGNAKTVACEQLLTEATQMLSEGNFDTALAKVRMGVVSCTGEQLGKANALKGDIEREANACGRIVSTIQSLITSKQLPRAQTKLDEMSRACSKSRSGQSVKNTTMNAQRDAAKALETPVTTAPTPKVIANEPAAVPTPAVIAPKVVANAPAQVTPSITNPPKVTAAELQQQPSTAQHEIEKLDKATADVRNGRLDAALTRVEDVLEMNPNNSDAKRLKAEIQRAQRKALDSIVIQ